MGHRPHLSTGNSPQPLAWIHCRAISPIGKKSLTEENTSFAEEGDLSHRFGSGWIGKVVPLHDEAAMGTLSVEADHALTAISNVHSLIE